MVMIYGAHIGPIGFNPEAARRRDDELRRDEDQIRRLRDEIAEQESEVAFHSKPWPLRPKYPKHIIKEFLTKTAGNISPPIRAEADEIFHQHCRAGEDRPTRLKTAKAILEDLTRDEASAVEAFTARWGCPP